MSRQSQTFVVSFAHLLSSSFRYLDSDWTVRLTPPGLRSGLYDVIVIQKSGPICSSANIEISYKLLTRFGHISGCCLSNTDGEWHSQTDQILATSSNCFSAEITVTRTAKTVSECNYVGNTLINDQTAFCDNNEYADISIIASDGSTIPAHKCFLMMRSSVFRRMFSNPMSESITNTITIDDVEPAAVRSFVRFTYTDQLNPCCVSRCMQLYRMAHKYEMQGLMVQCTQYLHKQLIEMNVIDILALGQFYNASDLRDSALHFISQHAAAFTSNAGFAHRVSVYLADYLSSAITSASSSTMVTDSSTSDTSATTFLTTSNPTTANTTTATTATTATTSATTYTPDMVLLSALAGTSPGISQYPHLTLTMGDAGPLLFRCERCSGR